MADDLCDDARNDHSWVWSIVNLLGVISVAAILWTVYSNGLGHRCGRSSSSNTCIANLKQIDGAKEQWALESRKTTNDLPAWVDLVGTDNYIKTTPVCPLGGIYKLNKVSEPPTCRYKNKPGASPHVLPQ